MPNSVIRDLPCSPPGATEAKRSIIECDRGNGRSYLKNTLNATPARVPAFQAAMDSAIATRHEQMATVICES